MKYAAYGLLAAFLASGVYGDIPTTAEGWYTPSGGFAAQSGTGTIYYGYDSQTGTWQTTTVTVDDEGNITGGDDIPFRRDYDLMTAYQALVKACANEAGLFRLSEGIETIGKHLDALALKDGIHIRNGNTMREFAIKPDQLAAPSADTDCAEIVFGTSAYRVILLENRSIDGIENNRAYCPSAKRQCGNDCAAYSFATYIEFLGKRNGWCGCALNTDEIRKMYEYAQANAPQNLKGGTARTRECFGWWTAETRSDNYELVNVWTCTRGGAVVDDVRALTKCLVRMFGGFLAHVVASDEWHLQNPLCRQACIELFGGVPDAIGGLDVDVTIETDSGAATRGGHAVVVYGYDADFVYFENSWGEGWGRAGHCKMTWPEFAREFVFGEVVADRAMLCEMLDASVVTQFSIKRNAHKSCGGHNGK